MATVLAGPCSRPTVFSPGWVWELNFSHIPAPLAPARHPRERHAPAPNTAPIDAVGRGDAGEGGVCLSDEVRFSLGI